MSDFYFRILGGPLFQDSERINNISLKVQIIGTVPIIVVFVGDRALCASPLSDFEAWVKSRK